MTDAPASIADYRKAHDNMSLESFGLKFSPPVDKSTVQRWQQGRISAARCIEVEAVTGIPREKLRPDLFLREAAE